MCSDRPNSTVDDQHWTLTLLHHLLANRAHEDAFDLSQAAAAHDYQIVVLFFRFFHYHFGRIA